MILNIPALVCIDIISKRAAAAAKAGSVVKIEGRDVLATWKLLIGILLFPLLYLVYSALLVIELHANGYLVENLFLTGSLFTLAVFPFLSYVSLRASEMGLDNFMSIFPIFFSFLHPGDGHVLRRMRHTLRRSINVLVDELGPKTFEDFESKRIIPRRKLSDTEAVEAFRHYSTQSQSSLDQAPKSTSEVGSLGSLGSVGAWINRVRPQEPDVAYSPPSPAQLIAPPHQSSAGDWSHLSENEIDEIFFQTQNL